jgi:hypothetical protein
LFNNIGVQIGSVVSPIAVLASQAYNNYRRGKTTATTTATTSPSPSRRLIGFFGTGGGTAGKFSVNSFLRASGALTFAVAGPIGLGVAYARWERKDRREELGEHALRLRRDESRVRP